MTLEQLKCTTRSFQAYLCLERTADLLRDARFFQRSQHVITNGKQPFPFSGQFNVTLARRFGKLEHMYRWFSTAGQVLPDLVGSKHENRSEHTRQCITDL